jgi:glycosyltransferase involved in cell wall biosynthesis
VPTTEPVITSNSSVIPATLILVAPRANSGGVGDYAEEFVTAAVAHFSSFCEIRTAGPGTVGLIDLFRYRTALSAAIAKAEMDGPVVVHFELSAASLGPFWLLAAPLRGVVTTATVHDPPWAVWWPFRLKPGAKSKLVHHGIHLPLRPFSARLERRLLRRTALFALSDVGATALRETFPTTQVLAARHFVPSRAALKPTNDRPLAVGLYGHASKGKGFERLLELRRELPEDVEVIVAGRGTENLPPVPGVTILGAVEGPQEDAFFESVRAILLPYDKISRFYGQMLPASGVASRAFAYGTPVIGFNSGTLGEAAKAGGLLTVSPFVRELAEVAFKTITDRAELERLEAQIWKLQKERGVREAVAPFVQFWRDAVGG